MNRTQAGNHGRHPRRHAAVAALLVLVGWSAGALAGIRATIPPPTIDARSYVLLDHASGAVLAEKNSDERVDPASITKIMTVYAAGHALKSGLITLEDEVVVSEKAWKMEGSRMFIEVGNRVSVDALLDGIIIQSGNDASVALAEHVSGSEEVFAGVMNEHARALGMEDSGFTNATGLPDPLTFVTAHDVALLSSALIREFPDLYARFAKREFVWNDIRQPNRNRLLDRDPSADGIKTGHTEAAGYCLASSAERDGMRLISVIMGAASDQARTEASLQLLNYGFRFYESRTLYRERETVLEARVWRGAGDRVAVGPAQPVAVTIPRGAYDELDAEAHLDEPVTAPLEAGQRVGTLTVSLDGESVAEVPLTALAAVAEGSLFSRLYDDLMLLFE